MDKTGVLYKASLTLHSMVHTTLKSTSAQPQGGCPGPGPGAGIALYCRGRPSAIQSAESAQSLTESWLPSLLRWQQLTQFYTHPSLLLDSIFVIVPCCPGPEDHSSPFPFIKLKDFGVGVRCSSNNVNCDLDYGCSQNTHPAANLTTPNS